MKLKLLLTKLVPGKRAFLAVFGLAFLAVAVIGFAFLRHRQLCSYNTAISTQQLQSNSAVDLCPSLTDPNKWGIILLNAFNPYSTASLTVNAANGIQVQTPTETCTDQLNPLCWVGDAKPSLKQTNGYTNILLVGLDTRDDFGLKNTDTIMLASLHHASGKVMLISFPRDLYVNYTNPRGRYVSYKINGIYALSGIEGLNGAISQISGKPIHYYAYVNLGVFTRIIDKLGGIDIVLDKPFKDWYPCTDVPAGHKECPKGYKGFATFKFPAGPNKFSSFDALVYTRARYLSSDFDRARRQQHVMSALMKSALNPDKPLAEKVDYYISLFNIFKQDVKTNIELKDVAGVLAVAQQINATPLSLTLDPTLGGAGRLIRNAGNIPGVGYSIKFNDRTYKQFQRFINEIWNNVAFYSERPKILVVNASGKPLPANSSIAKLTQNRPPYSEMSITTGTYDLKGLRVYDMTEKKPASLNYLQSLLPGSLNYSAVVDEITRSKWGEDLLVIWGGE
jgi:LCP family protein required for cell wall assembly